MVIILIHKRFWQYYFYYYCYYYSCYYFWPLDSLNLLIIQLSLFLKSLCTNVHASTYVHSRTHIFCFVFFSSFSSLSFEQEIVELKSVIAESQDDRDMKEMASEELVHATEEEKKLQSLLLKTLLPKDDADERDCILEVRAGKMY